MGVAFAGAPCHRVRKVPSPLARVAINDHIHIINRPKGAFTRALGCELRAQPLNQQNRRSQATAWSPPRQYSKRSPPHVVPHILVGSDLTRSWCTHFVEQHFGVAPPDIGQGARLAALIVAVRDRGHVAALLEQAKIAATTRMGRIVVGPQDARGAAIVFEQP